MRFLVIRLTALGDVILSEPVSRALKDRYAGAEVHLVTEARYAPLMERASGFDRVVPYDRHGTDRGLSGFKEVLGRLRALGPFDAVIDLQNKLRTRTLAARLNAPQRLTFRKRTVTGSLRAIVGDDPPIDGVHSVGLYLSALDALDVDAQPRAPVLEIARRTGARRRIGLCPGTTHATKRWPSDRFAALADRLGVLEDVELVLIGGPTDRDVLQDIREQTRAALDPTQVEELDVERLAECVASLDALVTVDSGPAHLGAALGVPTVALFGPTSPLRWGPIGSRHRVASLSLPCAPCSNHGTARCPVPERAHACMRDLSVDEVHRLTLEVLPSKQKVS